MYKRQAEDQPVLILGEGSNVLFLKDYAGTVIINLSLIHIWSTGGGLKVIRILLLFKQGNRELKRLVHPNAVYSIKVFLFYYMPRS